VLAGAAYGERIVPRLSDHRGFHLVAVADHVGAEAAEAFAAQAPRRVYFVLVDGLRADVAAGLSAWKALGAAGRCRKTHVSLPTVSRPVYAMLSTGVEQDRTGARNNDETSPLAAESVWQVAREAGMKVVAYSTLTWWRELFPGGFDRYEVGRLDDDLFAYAAGAPEDVVLVHPVHVDEAGHAHGGASKEYRAEAARADRELGGLLAKVDLARDVVVVTADHGHSARGGHGGDGAEVATTLTCYAGRGVGRGGDASAGTEAAWLEERNLGPLVAVLAGLRFPRHMRPGLPPAVWDDLAAGLPAAYVADRRAAETRFVLANDTLPSIYASARRAQLARGAAAAVALLLVFAAVARRRRLGLRGTLALAAWIVATIAVHVVAYVVFRGPFDATSINRRGDWIIVSMAVGLGAGVFGVIVYHHFARRLPPVGHLLTLPCVGLGVAAVHAAAYGWVLGFPLPGAVGYFLPFFISAFVVAHAFIALGVALRHVVRGA
jgi:hypothetical protein